MKRKQRNLEQQLYETETILDDIVKIFELDDVLLRYNSLIGQLQNLKEYEKMSYIQNYLKVKDIRENKYNDFILETKKLVQKKCDSYKDKNEETYHVRYINSAIELILQNIKYKKTTKDMYYFYQTKSGQCYHISRFFKDILTAEGIEAKIIKGYIIGQEDEGLHAWNCVNVYGKNHYFDLTFELNKNQEKNENWCWLDEQTILSTHIPLYQLEK